MVVPAVIGFAALAISGYFLVGGGRELRTVYHILRNDPRPIQELDGYTGPVEVEGRAIPDEEHGTVTAPFTGTACLAYTYEAAELRSSGKQSEWKTLDEGEGGVPFLVEDDTDRIRVAPAGADLRLAEATLRVSPGEELPDHLAGYVGETGAVDRQDRTVNLLITELHVGNEQRFTERRLDIGEAVYVYGAAERGSRPEWGSGMVDAVIRAGAAAPVFVISDTGERGTAWRFAAKGLGRVGIGIVVLAVGSVFLWPFVGL